MNEKSVVEGLVLQVIDYQNNDGILHVLTKDQGVVSLFARGIQKDSSKNRRLGMPFTKVSLNYDPRYSKKMLYLINGSVLASYWKAMDSLVMQTINAIVTSLMERYSGTLLCYECLEAMWNAFHKGDLSQGILMASLLVSDVLAEEGTLMNVDGCMRCQRTNQLAGLSFEKGGFVCIHHMDTHTLLWPKERLLQVRRLVKAIEALRQLDLRLETNRLLIQKASEKLQTFSWDLDFFLMLMDWYSWFQDTSLPSIDFLKKLHQSQKNTMNQEKVDE